MVASMCSSDQSSPTAGMRVPPFLISVTVVASNSRPAMAGASSVPSPSMPWHFAQTPSNVSLPTTWLDGACAARKRVNSASLTACTEAVMEACWAPQSSAQRPVNVPVRSALNHVWFVRPGMASILPPSAGIHQLWMTSGATTSRFTTLFTGTTRSSTAISPPG